MKGLLARFFPPKLKTVHIGLPDNVTVIEDQSFDSLNVFHHQYVIQNLDVHRCSFANCSLHPQDLETRTLIQNVRMFNCRTTDKFTIIGAPILDEVLIENFRCGSIFLAFGAAFRHVTLRGHMPNANFNEQSRYGRSSQPIEHLGNDLNRDFYQNVDWALDISQANLGSMNLSSIPDNSSVATPLRRCWSRRPNSSSPIGDRYGCLKSHGFTSKAVSQANGSSPSSPRRCGSRMVSTKSLQV